jgi:hypothetical protein
VISQDEAEAEGKEAEQMRLPGTPHLKPFSDETGAHGVAGWDY